MATQIKRRRGTTSQHSSFIGADAELTVDSDKNTVVVHDNSTAGGHPLAKEDWLSVEPHIIPGVLYPSSGNDLAGDALVDSTEGPNSSTVDSSKYGTVQASDGRMYYYTDIKGSKPIKDPRIGAHFGSQRHTCTSLQLLEQETATHGKNTYSIDGREWMRIQGTVDRPRVENGDSGNFISCGNAGNARAVELEITGYFNKANISGFTNSYPGRKWESCWVNGTEVTTDTTFVTSVTSPLGSRCVSAGSLIPIEMGTVTSPQITTIRLVHDSDGESNLYAIELIAQDTSNRNNIQIPSQNVVSYGKKFSVSGTPHYNPFAFKTDGTTAWTSGNHNGTAWPVGTGSSHNIDTATSLGLKNWKHTDDNYYKPYNGGRVVLWVDNSGVLKTSVTVMPPLAKSIADSNNLTPSASSDSITAASANSEYRPYFGQNDAYDASGKEAHGGLHEVAKTFHWREFGNGGANGNASFKDSSIAGATAIDTAYVMDDGLTSLTWKDTRASFGAGDTWEYAYSNVVDSGFHLTFIGTGISLISRVDSDKATTSWCQNLPYGTHILKVWTDGSDHETTLVTIDGVLLHTGTNLNGWASMAEATFHQPKRPPIPEDAVVLADYMLMADFVITTSDGSSPISKGVRRVDCSRDIFYDSNSTFSAMDFVGSADTQAALNGTRQYGGSSNAANKYQLPAFCTNQVQYCYNLAARFQTYSVDTGSGFVAQTVNKIGSSSASFYDNSANTHTLGLATHKAHGTCDASSGYLEGIDVVSPIHTSSHYQSFETPFLHELVGGDRNMEQNNLIVTPDGKSWDEVTRDTSYIGGNRISVTEDVETTGVSASIIFTDHRGQVSGSTERDLFNKGFAIAYDRFICLENGNYIFSWIAWNNSSGDQEIRFTINDQNIVRTYKNASTNGVGLSGSYHSKLERGDFIRLVGSFGEDGAVYNSFTVTKV